MINMTRSELMNTFFMTLPVSEKRKVREQFTKAYCEHEDLVNLLEHGKLLWRVLRCEIPDMRMSVCQREFVPAVQHGSKAYELLCEVEKAIQKKGLPVVEALQDLKADVLEACSLCRQLRSLKVAEAVGALEAPEGLMRIEPVMI